MSTPAPQSGGSSSNTGIVAIVVIFVIVLVLGFLAFRGGMFGGAKSGGNLNVKVDVGGSSNK